MLSGCFQLTVLFLLVSGSILDLRGQDPHFSQYYAHPLYLNPALAGTGECGRIIAGFRNQWPGIDQTFTTATLEADRYIDALSGGVGITVLADDAAGLINTLRMSGMYAYHLKISREMSLNAGFEAVYHQQRMDWDELVFRDMIDVNTGNILPGTTGEVPPSQTSVSAIDLSTGFMLGISDKYYIGISGHHLAEPELGYYISDEAVLYRKYALHGGAHFVLVDSYYPNDRGELSLNPNVVYQRQKNAQQLNLGLNLSYHPFVVGLWYRHNFLNPDALIGFVGLKHKYFNFGYSYDLNTNQLSSQQSGTHELFIGYDFNLYKEKNPEQ